MSERFVPLHNKSNKRKSSWDQPEQKHSIEASLDTKKKINASKQIFSVNIVTKRQKAFYRKKIQQLQEGILEYYDQMQHWLEASKKTQISKKEFFDQMHQALNNYKEAVNQDKKIRSQIQKVDHNSNKHIYLLQKLERQGRKISYMKRNYQDCRKTVETNNQQLKMLLKNIRLNLEHLQQENRRLDQYQSRLTFDYQTGNKNQ